MQPALDQAKFLFLLEADFETQECMQNKPLLALSQIGNCSGRARP